MKGQKTTNMGSNRFINNQISRIIEKCLNRKRLLIFLSPLILLTNACYYDIIIEEEIEVDEEISFSADIEPIFQATCIACHNGITTNPDLTENNAFASLSSGNYISTTDPEESTLITKINSGHPYENALTNSEVEKLILWMEAGAKDN